MNPYIKLKRVEFVLTNNCTGKCKHCSVGDKIIDKTHIKYNKIEGLLTKLAPQHQIESIMCFGGEPLLYADDVCGIMSEAAKCNIKYREIITNGFFSKQDLVIANTVLSLEKSGVTNILLSVDTFHQETIPLNPVYSFAKQVTDSSIDISLHPSWLVNEQTENEFNNKTKEILHQFSALKIPISNGNNIFPAGNAITNFSDYFEKVPFDLNQKCGEAPYSSKLDEVDCISINPNGDIVVCCFVIGNVYNDDIIEIIEQYNPNQNPMMVALMNGGVTQLLKLAENMNIKIDILKHYSACSVCQEITKNVQNII